MSKNGAGRPKQTELERLRSMTSRLFLKYQSLMRLSDADLEEKHIQYDAAKGKMGRPALSIKIKRERALNNFEDALKKYQAQEKAEGVEPVPFAAIALTKVKDKAGRPRMNELDRLRRYIRQQEVLIFDLELAQLNENTGCSTLPERTGKRIPRTPFEQIQVLKKKIELAKQDYQATAVTLPLIDVLKSERNEILADLRQFKMLINKPEHWQMRKMRLRYTDEYALAQIKQLEIDLHKINEKISHVVPAKQTTRIAGEIIMFESLKATAMSDQHGEIQLSADQSTDHEVNG
ncbi:hypothetical protein [uncultured Tolumonas sp.]|uniref:hypothetical protein n=1 Tax=uncultured Tolumonas sp. TaxID=263765 RepID=UPI00292D46AC|nr:hypothetical protein [uncultured Tolumonas sp.]